MRILILGGDGMLGHQLEETLSPRHEVFVTLHGEGEAYAATGVRFGERALFGVDALSDDALRGAIAEVRPLVVLNAVGVVKQRMAASDALKSIALNALLPHRLAALCGEVGAFLVQISTDCVFSGRKGGYVEADPPNPVDLYGRSKLLGEVVGARCLTLRTSIIGLELSRRTGLVEWFLAQRGRVPGYTRAIYSGLTTEELARAIRAPVDHG